MFSKAGLKTNGGQCRGLGLSNITAPMIIHLNLRSRSSRFGDIKNESLVCPQYVFLVDMEFQITYCLPTVCPPGLYDADCSTSCPSWCNGKGCDIDGVCLGNCPAGKTGNNCLERMSNP